MAAVAAAKSDLPLQEKLALAQAASQVGVTDWSAVSHLLGTAQAHLTTLDRSAKASAALFSALLAEHNLTSSAQPAQALAHKLYAARIAELVASIKETHEEESSLNDEIQAINAGEYDDQLLAAAPEKQRQSIAASRSPSAKPAAPSSEDKQPAHSNNKHTTRKGGRRSGRKGHNDDDSEPPEVDEHPETVPDSDTDAEAAAPATGKRDKGKTREKDTPSKVDKKRDRAERDKDEKEKDKSSPAKNGRHSTRKSGRTAKGRHAEEEEEETHDEDEEDEEEVKQEDDDEKEEENEEEGEDEDDDEDDDDDDDENEEEEEDEPATTRASSRRKQSLATSTPKPTISKGRMSKRLKTDDAADEGGSEMTDKEAKAKVQRFKATAKNLIANLLGKPNAHGFANPVTDRIAKGYKSAVRRPMSLSEVQRNVKAEKITTLHELQRDVVLVFANAIQFNGPRSELGKQAKELWAEFEALYQIALTTEFAHGD